MSLFDLLSGNAFEQHDYDWMLSVGDTCGYGCGGGCGDAYL